MNWFKEIIVAALCFFVAPGTYAQVIAEARKVNWTVAGLQGNKPNYQNVLNIKNFGGTGDGSASNNAALQAAIQSLNGDSGVILFPAGTYLFLSPVTLRSGLVLRGQDASSTTLQFNLTGTDHLVKVAGDSTSDVAKVTSAAYKNQYSVIVDEPALFKVDDYVKIFQNDAALVKDAYALTSVGQILRVESITGNLISFNRPLRKNYLINDVPRLQKLTMATGVGIECLKIKRLDGTIKPALKKSNIFFEFAAQCWISGVESDSCHFAHIDVANSTNIEIAGSYFHGAFSYGGGFGYGISIEYTSGENLVENNIFRRLRHSMILQSGANGNVLAYNYSREPFKSESFPNDLSGDIVLHGNYTYANLFEGNIVQNIVVDASHGINGPYNTFFRNRAELYGIFISDGAGDSTNLVGNEISGTGFGKGNYSLKGNGNFEYGNNKNSIITPAGTTTLTESSYHSQNIPRFWNVSSSWPSIGSPNTISSGTLPAKARYEAAFAFTVCSGGLSTVGLYTFTGNGDWNNAANWTDNRVPSNFITTGMEVIINPAAGGECTINGTVITQQGGILKVLEGKILNIIPYQ